MKLLSRVCFVVLSLVLVTAEPAQAQISVNRVIIYFGHGERPVRNIEVFNSGKDPMYVVTEPVEVFRAGFEDERREPTKSLIVSPKRFSIQGNGQRTVRLFLRERPGDAERVFRVSFLPQTKGPSEEENPAKKTLLKVVFTVGILLFSQPKVPEPKFRWERKGREITFINEGNVNVYLGQGQYCSDPPKDGNDWQEDECAEIGGKRVYPGNTWTTTVPGDKTVIYRKAIAENFEKIVID